MIAASVAELMRDDWRQVDICFNCIHCRARRGGYNCARYGGAVSACLMACSMYTRADWDDIRRRDAPQDWAADRGIVD